jgi:hypothetical protein
VNDSGIKRKAMELVYNERSMCRRNEGHHYPMVKLYKRQTARSMRRIARNCTRKKSWKVYAGVAVLVIGV